MTCYACGAILDPDDVVWVDLVGQASVEHGESWCVGCAPEQLDFDKDRP